MHKPSKALAGILSAFAHRLPEPEVEKAMALMPNFVDEKQLAEWTRSDGRPVALARGLMAMAQAELATEGTEITMMQYLWYKQRSLKGGVDPADFDYIEQELLADIDSLDSYNFLCELWSVVFVKRVRQRFLGKEADQGETHH